MLPKDAQNFCSQQNNVNTQDAYEHDLRVWFEYLGDREPTKGIAIAFRTELETRFSARTAGRRFNTCRAYYRWALDIHGVNVFDGVKSPRRLRNATPDVPTDRSVDALLDGAVSPRDKALICLLLNGLRASEVIVLGPGDWGWSPDHGCHIIKVTGKGFKQRMVPANTLTSKHVSAYLSISKRGVPWLLGSLKGNEPMTRSQAYKAVERACKNAGIPRIHPHQLRHHFGTRLWRSSKNLLALQHLMGHESPVTTQVYVHMDLDDIVGAMKTDPRNERTQSLEDYPNYSASERDSYQGTNLAERGKQGIRDGTTPVQRPS